MGNRSVAIILVNWNAYTDTIECLKSINELTNANFKVFLVDNGSTDYSYNKFEKYLLNEGKELTYEISLIDSKGNLGFAGGNNVGLKQAYEEGFEYFWLLNNDTTVESNALSVLVDYLEEHKEVGVTGSKIYYYGTNKIWFAGGTVNTKLGKSKHIGMRENDEGQFDSIREVDYITGCSLCFRKEVLEDTGYMNEDYFLYYEETEWNIRIRKNNWSIKYVPESVVHHKVSFASGGENNLAPYVTYYEIRNAFVMIRRTQDKLSILTAFLFIFYKIFKKHVKIILKNENRKLERSRLSMRAVKDALGMKMGKLS